MSQKKPDPVVTHKKVKYVLLNVTAHSNQASGLLYVPVENVRIFELYAFNETVYPHLELVKNLASGRVSTFDDEGLEATTEQVKLSRSLLPTSKVAKYFENHMKTNGADMAMFRYRIVNIHDTDSFSTLPGLNSPYWKHEIGKRLCADLELYALHATNATQKLQTWLRLQSIFLRDMK